MKIIQHHVQLIDARETVVTSVLKDVVTFGFLLFCIWVSLVSTVWTVITVLLFMLFMAGKIGIGSGIRVKKFKSFEEIEVWAKEMRKLTEKEEGT